MKLSSRTRVSFLVLILFATSIFVYAQVISPSGMEGFPWGNFTAISVDEVWIQGDNLTDYAMGLTVERNNV